jgi:serine protease Do
MIRRLAAPLLSLYLLAAPAALADDNPPANVAQPTSALKSNNGDTKTAPPSVTGGGKKTNGITTTDPHKEPYPAASPHAVVAVTEKVFPAVVRLDVVAEVYREGKRDRSPGIGSGVIIDADGRVLTNYHVAGRASEINVTLFNKERIPAKLIGDDHWTDLAIVQLDMDEVKKRGITFKYAELGRSNNLLPGQDVMAIGTPYGFSRTLTLGVVSNPDQTFYPQNLEINGYETGDFSNWIQMDTPINPGNSGGPLVDLTGRIVGINTRGGGQNLNFAIPVDTAREVIDHLLKTATADREGKVVRSDLGLEFKPLQDLEAFYGIDINKGVLVNSVERKGPAQKAGVRTSDILLEIDGKPVNARFPEELAAVRKLIADCPVGAKLALKVKRGNQTLDLVAETEKLESALGEEKEFKTWGISVRDVTHRFANEKQLDDDKGVWITSMSQGYPAAKAELQYGDIIRSVNMKPVTDLDEFIKLYDASVKNKDEKVLINYERNRGQKTALLKVYY